MAIDLANKVSLSGVNIERCDISQRAGSLGLTARVEIAYQAGSVPSSSFSSGEIITLTVGGFPIRMRILSRTESHASDGWGMSLYAIERISEIGDVSPYPKPINYMSMAPYERTEWEESINQATFYQQKPDTEYNAIIKDSLAFGVAGHRSNTLIRDLALRAGFSDCFTNLLSYTVRQVLVDGSYLDALIGLTAPFQPVFYEDGGVLFILDNNGLSQQVFTGTVGLDLTKITRLERHEAFHPRPESIIVRGGQGPFNPTYYEGTLVRDANGNAVTSQTTYSFPYGWTPPNYTAVVGNKADNSQRTIVQDFRGETWKDRTFSVKSYGQPIVVGHRTSQLAAKVEAGTEFFPDEEPSTQEILQDMSPEEVAAYFVAADPLDPFRKMVEAYQKDSTENTDNDASAKPNPVADTRQASMVLEVYDRTIFNTKGALHYRRTVNFSRGLDLFWRVQNVVEEMEFPQYTNYYWSGSRLESKKYWDAAKSRVRYSPCAVRVEWGWATIPVFSEEMTNVWELIGEDPQDPGLSGASMEWIPLRVDLTYRSFATPAGKSNFVNTDWASLYESLLGNAGDPVDPADLQTWLDGITRIAGTDYTISKTQELMEPFFRYKQSPLGSWVKNYLSRMETHSYIPQNAEQHGSSAYPAKPYSKHGAETSQHKRGDLIFEQVITYQPVCFEPKTGVVSLPQKDDTAEQTTIAYTGGVFLPPSWTYNYEAERAAGSVDKRRWEDIIQFQPCITENKITSYSRINDTRRGYYKETQITKRDPETGEMVTNLERLHESGEPPNERLDPRPQEIKIRRALTSTAGKKSTRAIPLIINAPYAVQWTDARKILDHFERLTASDKSVAWTVQFPAPLFFDSGWKINLQAGSISPSPVGEGSDGATTTGPVVRSFGRVIETSINFDSAGPSGQTMISLEER